MLMFPTDVLHFLVTHSPNLLSPGVASFLPRRRLNTMCLWAFSSIHAQQIMYTKLNQSGMSSLRCQLKQIGKEPGLLR